MNQWRSVDEALNFAIDNEIQAYEFYTEWAGRVDDAHTKKIFLENAKEEQGHRAKLEAIKSGKKLLSAEKKVLDLKISDYLVEVQPKSEMDFQSALILAMNREKAAFRLYSDLAAQTDDSDLRGTFLGLAQEEAGHKLRFELQYDDEIYKEN